jgi:hypothetical protein
VIRTMLGSAILIVVDAGGGDVVYVARSIRHWVEQADNCSVNTGGRSLDTTELCRKLWEDCCLKGLSKCEVTGDVETWRGRLGSFLDASSSTSNLHPTSCNALEHWNVV